MHSSQKPPSQKPPLHPESKHQKSKHQTPIPSPPPPPKPPIPQSLYCFETIDEILCPCYYYLKPPVCSQLQKLMTNLPETHKTTQVWEKVVVKCGMLLYYVPEDKKTKQMCDIAVFTNPRAFMFVPDHLKTKQMCVHAVSSKYCGLENLSFYVPRYLMKEVCLEIIMNYAPLCCSMTKCATNVVLFEVCKDIIAANQNKSRTRVFFEHDCCLDSQKNMYINNNICGEVCEITLNKTK